MRRHHLIITAVITAICWLRTSAGAERWSLASIPQRVTLNPTLKLTELHSHNPGDRLLYPHRSESTAMLRLRLDLHTNVREVLDVNVAYELGSQWLSRDRDDGAGSRVLPAGSPVPFRMHQLVDGFADGDRFGAAHELDRALVAIHPDWGEVTIGRQAIGLGRGVMFSAVDMFSPFNTLEADREWRRGVDAARMEIRLSSTASAELIAVAGESWDASALLLRLRGYFGPLDAELLGGKRGRDGVAAVVVSSTVGAAEVHAEAAVFRTPEDHPEGTILKRDNDVPKVVLGSSYTFGIGNGITLLLEYHYSGFGAGEAEDAQALFAAPGYDLRLTRGDTQTLGQHACGIQLTYPVNEAVVAGVSTFASPVDGSGVVSPTLRWDLSATTSLVISGYIPWGQRPDGGRIRSEYGTFATSLFAQLGMYF
ncbi:MAG: hypothetical protein HN742_22945 [Lentisphaerae bacterium]|jgi:hypothetical protein|nr:hypothetical protein [Lentisphaerota bacterium]MBT4817026.1 hypothetical protein [Lentisphaerota bacterium]MBT5606216.1 hypothetical protein [Lentisphaerota bacterium]MBT7060394.1 hypothetical protein [Lentisphaerota bacterium]MBT7844752.1 hypothetical protein [Lentisphaerota bacterium]